jgi:hypothetical protein
MKNLTNIINNIKIINTNSDELCPYAEKTRYLCKVYVCTTIDKCIYQVKFGWSRKYCEKELNRDDSNKI